MEVKRFLDSDQRPQATAIVASVAEFNLNSNGELEFSGVLGAIESSKPLNYVGFCGIELKMENQSVVRIHENHISFSIKHFYPSQGTFTFHLITEDQKSEERTYGLDHKMIPISKVERIQFSFSQFCLSYRGEYENEFFDGQKKIKKIRIFFRRSQNLREETAALPVGFVLIEPTAGSPGY